jgi:sulfur carrier protein ThiS
MEDHMLIKLTLEAILGKYVPDDPDAYEVPFGMNVGELIAKLGIPEHLVMFVIVNGQMATLDTILQDNSSVSLCPYICGG